MIGQLCSAMVLMTGLLHAADGRDVVERRGIEEALAGEIVSIDDAGVTVRTGIGSGALHLVPWDRIRDVSMDDPPSHLEERLEAAEQLWRARARLERGDAAMAEPLFERLFERFRGGTHETALVVAEGLLRCRLERYELPLAIVPALEVARLRRADITTDRYITLDAVYDAATSLCISLPPVWLDDAPPRRVVNDVATYDAQGDEIVAALAALYAMSLGADGDAAEAAFRSREASRHVGVRLLRDMIATRTNEGGRGDTARARLLRDMRTFDEWSEAWARYHIGVSLLDSSEAARADIGAVQLSHLPARFAHRQPYLAGLAVVRLIEFAEDRGQASAADSLRTELDRRFVFHPVNRAGF